MNPDAEARHRRPRKPSPAERRQQRASVDDVAEVVDAAARFLEPRPRAIAEVRRRLSTAGYRPALVEAALERLLALGYLDDAAFARTWVDSRDRAHPRGELALRRELRLKGIEPGLIEATLTERRERTPVEEGEVDDAAAERLLRRQAQTLARIADPRARRNRAYQVLARHGFDSGTASRVAARLFDPDRPE
jgi:regulatory protein